MVQQQHILVVAYPAQGHLNPALRLAHRLIRMGAMVTICTTLHMHRSSRIDTTSSAAIPGLSFAPFSDGYDHHGFIYDHTSVDAFKASASHYFSHLRLHGWEFVANLIASAKHNVNGCHPFTCIVHTMALPWAAELARQLHLPSALLWVQPATLFAIFHYYFKDDNLIKTKLLDDDEDSSDDSVIIELPGLPPLKRSELPSSIACPSSIHSFVLPLLAEDLRVVQQQPNATVLVNTLDELEDDALNVVDDYCFRTIAVGPLVPSILLDGQNQSLSHSTLNDDCMEWLGSKAESSVTYISFGSHCVLSKRQMEEIARGLLKCGRPFLWSIREEKEQEKVEEFREEMEEQGKMIKWCDQVEILSHKSVGCFVSHCGWNSILESMVAGVPVVGIPQWADQPTNAKLVEEVWKTGVKVRVTAEGIVRGEEIRRCVEEVMGNGERGKEVRKNAAKWREVSREAVKVGGSSDANLRAFLHNLGAVSPPHN